MSCRSTPLRASGGSYGAGDPACGSTRPSSTARPPLTESHSLPVVSFCGSILQKPRPAALDRGLILLRRHAADQLQQDLPGSCWPRVMCPSWSRACRTAGTRSCSRGTSAASRSRATSGRSWVQLGQGTGRRRSAGRPTRWCTGSPCGDHRVRGAVVPGRCRGHPAAGAVHPEPGGTGGGGRVLVDDDLRQMAAVVDGEQVEHSALLSVLGVPAPGLGPGTDPRAATGLYSRCGPACSHASADCAARPAHSSAGPGVHPISRHRRTPSHP